MFCIFILTLLKIQFEIFLNNNKKMFIKKDIFY